MKRCPACHRVENDNSLSFCRVDGTALISDASGYDAEAQTVQLGSATSSEIRTTLLDPTNPIAKPAGTRKFENPLPLALGIVAAFILALAVGGYFFITKKFASIDSIAVLPFENQNNDSETEYLADGLTETTQARNSDLLRWPAGNTQCLWPDSLPSFYLVGIGLSDKDDKPGNFPCRA